MSNRKFKKGDRAFVRTWPHSFTQCVEIIGFADTNKPLPHYIVKAQGGACYQISQLELSSIPIYEK
tara:strand:- start:269 stop:466 length:198 start_codon:yes stop_codon:yes gene_type:complete